MASSVKSISYLQKELYPLLSNIHVKDEIKPIGTFNIADTTDENIYKIPEGQLNLDTEKYKQFLQFMIIKLTENNNGYMENKGDILTAYCLDEENVEYKQEMDKIKKIYQDLYFSKYRPPQNKYPYWKTELLEKSSTVLYKNQEKKLGIKNILEQNDDEFLKTIEKRRDGLTKCFEEEKDTSTFYSEESSKLTKILEDKH